MNNLRLIGVFPLIFGIWTCIIYFHRDQVDQLFWFCNISNFLMAFALFYRNNLFVWITTIWLIMGTPLWLYEDILNAEFRLHAVFVHIGSVLIGLFYIRKNPGRPPYVIITSILMGAFSQIISRIFTAPRFNVNMSHHVYPTLTKLFPNFWIYTFFNYISFIVLIFILVKLIVKFSEFKSVRNELKS